MKKAFALVLAFSALAVTLALQTGQTAAGPDRQAQDARRRESQQAPGAGARRPAEKPKPAEQPAETRPAPPARDERGRPRGGAAIKSPIRVAVSAQNTAIDSVGRTMLFFVETGSDEHPIICLAGNDGFPPVLDYYAEGAVSGDMKGVRVRIRFREEPLGNVVAVNLWQPNMTIPDQSNRVFPVTATP